MIDVGSFFEFARERYRIFLAKESGEPRPWTDDPVLLRYSFCNIFREDDKVSRYLKREVRDPVAQKAYCLEAVAGMRWFNRIEVVERIKDILVSQGWNSGMIGARLAGVSPLVTGAYMIKTPAGMNKLEGICDCMDKLVSMKLEVGGMKLQDAHAEIMKAPYLGSFMAYEIVTDLRHTPLLCDAPDIDSWTVAGPGAARGLGWILYDDPTTFSYTSKHQQDRMLGYMRELLGASRGGDNWPQGWPDWEMREVEHTLCEYDKWRRGSKGQKLKRLYR